MDPHNPWYGLPRWLSGEEFACNAGDMGLTPQLGRSPGERLPTPVFLDFLGGSDGKESACNAGDLSSIPGLGRFPWRMAWQPTPVFLPGESP